MAERGERAVPRGEDMGGAHMSMYTIKMKMDMMDTTTATATKNACVVPNGRFTWQSRATQ